MFGVVFSFVMLQRGDLLGMPREIWDQARGSAGTFFLKPVVSDFPWPQLFYIFIARYKQIYLELFFKNKRKPLAVYRNKPKSPKLECHPCCIMPVTDT